MIKNLLGRAKLKKGPPIKLLIMDCDNTLTTGDVKNRIFHSQDGYGLCTVEIKTAIITGYPDDKLDEFCTRVGIDYCIDTAKTPKTKLSILRNLCDTLNIKADEVCYIGDDLNDLLVIKNVGFGVAVNNAVDSLVPFCDYITKRKGGEGAVREVIELLWKFKKI